jgi:hypothetical protein
VIDKKLIVLVQGRECFYNLQHKDYDNNLVKDKCCKETAGELHAPDKELSRRTQHCWKMAGEQHGMCESALKLPDSVTSALKGGRLSAICTSCLCPQE